AGGGAEGQRPGEGVAVRPDGVRRAGTRRGAAGGAFRRGGRGVGVPPAVRTGGAPPAGSRAERGRTGEPDRDGPGPRGAVTPRPPTNYPARSARRPSTPDVAGGPRATRKTTRASPATNFPSP